MKRTVFLLVSAVAIALSLPIVVNAQWYRGNLNDTLRRLEEDSDRFAKSLDRDLDRSRIIERK